MEYITVVLQPFQYFFNLVSDNPFGVGDGILLLIILGAVYRFLLQPIVGGSSGSSDTVKKKKGK